MALRKEVKGLGMPWEDEYGYVQAVKVGDTIYVSGQLSHDDQGNIVGAAPLDDSGKIRDHSNMSASDATLNEAVESSTPQKQPPARTARSSIIGHPPLGSSKPHIPRLPYRPDE